MHELKKLPYAYDALEPFIDKETMELHHSKHHKTYVDKLNAALEKSPELQEKSADWLVINWKTLPAGVQQAVRNHGGGVWNHDFFWQVLKTGTTLQGDLLDAINKRFGSFDNFKKEYTAAAIGVFGSGWAWLVVRAGKLEIVTTPNQDSPITDGMAPLLTIDVWEHAYYVKYRNRRAEYVENFFNVINWEKVNELYGKAGK